jgi:hypothetical protein
MNVPGLFPAEPEINPAKPMDACLHPRPPAHLRFNFTDGAHAGWMKQAGHSEQ